MNSKFDRPADRSAQIAEFVVTAAQMQQIEARVFAAGMPVAALMEKVAGLITQRLLEQGWNQSDRVGVLAGPGHNGGDALVVARELHLRGYEVLIGAPVTNVKELTATHARYCTSLGIPFVDVELLQGCDRLIDGLFGFGLERAITGTLADIVTQLNQWRQPIVSIDLPSGLHTDTGEVLGTAICATHTLCLGLWKQGLLQDQALEWVGTAELLDFGLPLADISAVLDQSPAVRRITPHRAIAQLPLVRPPATHKYKMGHLLLVCGSRRYAGGAVLTGLGARASGVGMLSIAAPASLKPVLTAQLPEALVLDCPETDTGAICQFPDGIDLSAYDAVACGPGLTLDAAMVVQAVLTSDRPLVLDADGLNCLAQQGTIPTLARRSAMTILTPHLGEFKRLFPEMASLECRISATRQAAQTAGAIVLLKGARVVIASPTGAVWINPESSPALARGGSGDVLTGLMGGLLAQAATPPGVSTEAALAVVQSAAWWHAQTGAWAAAARSQLGVDAATLSESLIPALQCRRAELCKADSREAASRGIAKFWQESRQ